jgi:hypothetical protein
LDERLGLGLGQRLEKRFELRLGMGKRLGQELMLRLG